MKVEFQIKRKSSYILSDEEKLELLKKYGLLKSGKEGQLGQFEVTRYPLFHMEFADCKDVYSSSVVKLILTDENEVYVMDVEYSKENGVLTMKDTGESFVLVITKRPFLFGGINEVKKPIELEYNPKAVW
jgi:hypothetical protein